MTFSPAVPHRCRLCRYLALTAALCVAGGPLIAHLEWVSPFRGFLMFLLGLLLVGASFGAAVVSGILNRGRFDSAVLLSSMAIVLVIVALLISTRQYPRINDITTDLEHPPRFVQAGTLPANLGRDLSYPRAIFAPQQARHYPHLGPLRAAVSPEVTFAHVVRVARTMPAWEITRLDPTAYALEGVATTRVFRFQDDFVIEVRADDSRSLVHMRSKSRDGRGDLGANAARIEKFFEALGKSLSEEQNSPL